MFGRHAVFCVCVGLAINVLSINNAAARGGAFDASAPVAVSFQAPESSVDEGAGRIRIRVVLSRVSLEDVTLPFSISGGIAREQKRGTGQDFSFKRRKRVIRIPAGKRMASITLDLVDDSFFEMDETVEFTLGIPNPDVAVLGEQKIHTLTLLDNDRPNLYSVRGFGAVGNGVADDTAAIQLAVDTLDADGGGVLHFPAGNYLVTSVTIHENITYVGYDAALIRPSGDYLESLGFDLHWVRTFTTYSNFGDPMAATGYTVGDSGPLIIQGLRFDGNSHQQGDYDAWELEHAALIFLSVDAAQENRLQVFIEDVEMEDGVGDGIHAVKNLDITVDACTATNVFRGGFTLTGGHSIAKVSNFTTSGDRDDTGIDIEVDAAGYEGDLSVEVSFDNLNLLDGDFDIGLKPGSTVTVTNSYADAPFNLFAPKSNVVFRNSTIKVGAADGKFNRIICPGDVLFDSCNVITTRKTAAGDTLFFAVADIWWQHSQCAKATGDAVEHGQRLVYRNSRIVADSNFLDDDLVYGFYSRPAAGAEDNRLIVEGGCISDAFDIRSQLVNEVTSPQPEIPVDTPICSG